MYEKRELCIPYNNIKRKATPTAQHVTGGLFSLNKLEAARRGCAANAPNLEFRLPSPNNLCLMFWWSWLYGDGGAFGGGEGERAVSNVWSKVHRCVGCCHYYLIISSGKIERTTLCEGTNRVKMRRKGDTQLNTIAR